MPSSSPTHQIRLVSNMPGPTTPGGHVEMTQMTLMSSASSSSRPNTTTQLPGSTATATTNEVAFVKGGKRKRLSKACDACHKSKRRCDGTAPCSNCYFASKDCTYTDSQGRPVPAPRNVHPALVVDPAATDRTQFYRLNSDNGNNNNNNNGTQGHISASATRPSSHHAAAGDFATSSSSLTGTAAIRGIRRPAESNENMVKRPRPEPLGVSSVVSPIGSAPSVESPSSPPSDLLDPATTHELTNLFFTHCNPARLIIHKPSFSAALAHEQIPSYLVLAVCANAAPHSKELGAKASMPRLAGVPFFNEAVRIMFDSSFRLVAEPNTYTAQALTLLDMHEVAASHAWTKHYQYFDLALQILEDKLDIASSDKVLSSPPGPTRAYSIERECARRCFWVIQTMGWINGIYTFKPMRPRSMELMRNVRLPCDETSFELGITNQGPEFMHTPGPRTKYASQFGHLCRVLSMYQAFETALATKEGADLEYAVVEARRAVDIWANSIPDHLRFTEENLDKQLEMFETSSNTGAWCFAFMHVLHACFILSLVETEMGSQREESIDWVRNQLTAIFAAIGHRAKNTILSACALWSYSKYQPNDPQLKKWDDDFEKIWGFRVCVVADQWRNVQAQQRQQLGRTYPVESVSQHDSPPACQVVDSSSPSTSTNSSPRESESSYSFGQGNGKSDPRASSLSAISTISASTSTKTPSGTLPNSGKTGHVMVSGPEEQLNHARADIRSGTSATTSLPSIRTMGILDKPWVPPTDAMQHVSLLSNSGTLLQPTNLNYHQQQHQHLLARQDDGRIQNGWSQQQSHLIQPVSNVRPTSGGMPVGLDWLNNE